MCRKTVRRLKAVKKSTHNHRFCTTSVDVVTTERRGPSSNGVTYRAQAAGIRSSTWPSFAADLAHENGKLESPKLKLANRFNGSDSRAATLRCALSEALRSDLPLPSPPRSAPQRVCAPHKFITRISRGTCLLAMSFAQACESDRTKRPAAKSGLQLSIKFRLQAKRMTLLLSRGFIPTSSIHHS